MKAWSCLLCHNGSLPHRLYLPGCYIVQHYALTPCSAGTARTYCMIQKVPLQLKAIKHFVYHISPYPGKLSIGYSEHSSPAAHCPYACIGYPEHSSPPGRCRYSCKNRLLRLNNAIASINNESPLHAVGSRGNYLEIGRGLPRQLSWCVSWNLMGSNRTPYWMLIA